MVIAKRTTFGGLLSWLSGVKLLFVALHPVALALYVINPAIKYNNYAA